MAGDIIDAGDERRLRATYEAERALFSRSGAAPPPLLRKAGARRGRRDARAAPPARGALGAGAGAAIRATKEEEAQGRHAAPRLRRACSLGSTAYGRSSTSRRSGGTATTPPRRSSAPRRPRPSPTSRRSGRPRTPRRHFDAPRRPRPRRPRLRTRERASRPAPRVRRRRRGTRQRSGAAAEAPVPPVQRQRWVFCPRLGV